MSIQRLYQFLFNMQKNHQKFSSLYEWKNISLYTQFFTTTLIYMYTCIYIYECGNSRALTIIVLEGMLGEVLRLVLPCTWILTYLIFTIHRTSMVNMLEEYWPNIGIRFKSHYIPNCFQQHIYRVSDSQIVSTKLEQDVLPKINRCNTIKYLFISKLPYGYKRIQSSYQAKWEIV